MTVLHGPNGSRALVASTIAHSTEAERDLVDGWYATYLGRSAQNGYAAALLAREGFTAGEHSLEGPRGFAAVQASAYDLSKITSGLGDNWDLRVNTYKPFPCGIVNHPTIDGCIQLHDEYHVGPDQISAVRLRVAPLVLDLCNQQHITKGLQGKFSVYHGAAVGLVRGKAGIQEYTDEAVNDASVKRVRERATAVADPSVTEDQASIEVELADGRTLTKFIEASLGNLKRPLSDRQLDAKFRDQGVLALPSSQVDAVLALCWKIDQLTDVGEIVRASHPA